MIIKNGLVFTPEGKFEKKDFYIEGEYVAKETTDNKEVEAEGCYVIPGLVDIHFHGCVRHDMCDGTEESIQALADYEAANGVLANLSCDNDNSRRRIVSGNECSKRT